MDSACVGSTEFVAILLSQCPLKETAPVDACLWLLIDSCAYVLYGQTVRHGSGLRGCEDEEGGMRAAKE
jgi:hypothetical protein